MMKKSSFAAMILGTVSGICFAIGMCMALLPEWNAFLPGVILGGAGLLLGLLTLLVWRRMEHKPPVSLSRKTLLTILIAVLGCLLLGVGMCLSMLGSNMLLGILIGVAGIVILLSLIPFIKGIKG